MQFPFMWRNRLPFIWTWLQWWTLNNLSHHGLHIGTWFYVIIEFHSSTYSSAVLSHETETWDRLIPFQRFCNILECVITFIRIGLRISSVPMLTLIRDIEDFCLRKVKQVSRSIVNWNTSYFIIVIGILIPYYWRNIENCSSLLCRRIGLLKTPVKILHGMNYSIKRVLLCIRGEYCTRSLWNTSKYIDLKDGFWPQGP